MNKITLLALMMLVPGVISGFGLTTSCIYGCAIFVPGSPMYVACVTTCLTTIPVPI